MDTKPNTNNTNNKTIHTTIEHQDSNSVIADISFSSTEDSFVEDEDDNEDDEECGIQSILTIPKVHPSVKDISNAGLQLSNYSMIEFASECTIAEFFRLFPDDQKLDYRVRLNDGRIELFELQSTIHEVAAEEFLLQLRECHRAVCSTGTSGIAVNNASVYKPDKGIYIKPRNQALGDEDSHGRKIPKLVLEVAYTQRYRSVFSLPQKYLSMNNHSDNGIQAVVVIVIRRSTSDSNAFQMVALLYRNHHRNNAGRYTPTTVVSFGHYLHPNTWKKIASYSSFPHAQFQGVGTNQPGGDNLVLPIAADILWHGINPATRGQMLFVQGSYNINLNLLRNAIIDCATN